MAAYKKKDLLEEQAKKICNNFATLLK